MTIFPRWPYQLAVIVDYPGGKRDLYGMFDTDDEAAEYIDRITEEVPDGTRFSTSLLFRK